MIYVANVFIRLNMYLFAGYLVGLWLAAPGIFSWTFSATLWGNLMVYIYLVFWPFILMWTLFVWSLLFVIIIFLVALVCSYFWD
jgi:hypothetical protein